MLALSEQLKIHNYSHHAHAEKKWPNYSPVWQWFLRSPSYICCIANFLLSYYTLKPHVRHIEEN